MNSARISCISKSIKQVETITCLTAFKYPLVFHKKFRRKQVNFMWAGSFIKNNNVYDFEG